jgi:hypothetical protein
LQNCAHFSYDCCPLLLHLSRGISLSCLWSTGVHIFSRMPQRALVFCGWVGESWDY